MSQVYCFGAIPPALDTAAIVGVLDNKSKVPLFTVEERVAQLKEITKDLLHP